MEFNTRCLQAGYEPGNGDPRQIPIYQNTTWYFDSSEHMAMIFDLEAASPFYSRISNPTSDAVASRLAALEGGAAAVLTASGQTASFFAVFNICQAGDHLIATSQIYGGTYNLFAVTLPMMGIEVTFVDAEADLDELKAAIKPNTKAIFGETLSNPALNVLDIEKFAALAGFAGVPLIVDNTFPTPYNCRPIEHGADIVVHSTTKYLDGHAAALGGAIIDAGNFDWLGQGDKFPGLTRPDSSYHGLVFAEQFGQKACYITRLITHLMRDLGAITTPQNAFILGMNIESLHVRMQRHLDNAQTIAEWLQNNGNVAQVYFPGLVSDSQHERAAKYFDSPAGSGVISFDLEGTREDAVKFLDALRVARIATHVADARTCVLHPASTTHRQLSDEQMIEAGVSPTMIRLSVGIEDISDLIADLDSALKVAFPPQA
ncbi:MAG: PLP-dependent transferase [Coriobacteriia bacterium]|nr:PLP-dependent transferase [Coriobacteriia bacterium]MCL2537412.1 PLP-dependent transferase [Coriobacteriia bacterium]